jgi:hypothetical protein
MKGLRHADSTGGATRLAVRWLTRAWRKPIRKADAATETRLAGGLPRVAGLRRPLRVQTLRVPAPSGKWPHPSVVFPMNSGSPTYNNYDP